MSRGRFVHTRITLVTLAALGVTAAAIAAFAPRASAVQGETPAPGRPVTVLLLAAVGDGGVPNAEVTVLTREQLKAEWGEMKITPLFSDWEDLFRRVGLKQTTDFGGTVIIPKPIDRSYIRASIAGQFAFSEINSTEGSPFLLKLEVDEELQVLCVDAAGKPVKGMHVGVTVPFVKEIKEPLDNEKELWLVDGVTGDDGIAHLEHMQWWAEASLKEARENIANARVAVTPIFPEFIRTKVNLEDPPKTPIKVVVPPTGRVIVPVPKNMLTYARVRVSIPGVDKEKRPWPLKVPYRVDGRDTGVAVFEHVALNAEIEYEVWWQGLGAPRRGVAKGPKTAGEEVTLPRLDSFDDGSKPPTPAPAQPPKKKS